MDETPAPIPSGSLTKNKTVIIVAIVVMLCCCCLGALGTFFAFFDMIMQALGLQ